MRRLFYCSLAGCFAAVLSCSVASAQTADTDPMLKQAMVENAIVNFSQSGQESARLYTGPAYAYTNATIKSNTFYHAAAGFLSGTVEYDGFIYERVPMVYDVAKDIIAVKLPGKEAAVALVSNRVQSFDIDGHHFIRVEADTLAEPKSISTGFYDQLYIGKTKVMAHYTKAAKSTLTEQLYIVKNGIYKSVNSEASVIEVLNDKEAELKQFIAANAISFKQNQGAAVAKVAAYYDQLSRPLAATGR